MLSYQQQQAVRTIQALQGAINSGRWSGDTGDILRANLRAFWASLDADDRRAIWEAGKAGDTPLSASRAEGQSPPR